MLWTVHVTMTLCANPSHNSTRSPCHILTFKVNCVAFGLDVDEHGGGCFLTTSRYNRYTTCSCECLTI